mmetsp:Transcript_7601/g.23049  ORF Transcript_7601/g.23049 Transcript_7601/m.23049 type:complete len:244 (+) Transcript_7601:94-825(+)
MCRCFRFDQLTTAGFALLTVGPVSLSPLPAMNCAEMYVNFLAAVSRATYLSAFLSVPLCLYLSTFGAVKISAVFVLSLLSGPFLLGMGVYQNLSVPSAAILGRISLALSWLFLLPQLLSTVARIRLGSLIIPNLFEVVCGVLALNVLTFGLSMFTNAIVIGNDCRLCRTMTALLSVPSGVVCSAIAMNTSMVSVAPCVVSAVVSLILGSLNALRLRRQRRRSILRRNKPRRTETAPVPTADPV